jgi:hypothetical protein
VPAARSSASALRRRPSSSPMLLLSSSQQPLSIFITDGAGTVFICDQFLRWSSVGSGEPPTSHSATGPASRAPVASPTLSCRHLHVLLLRSHHVLGTFSMGDLSSTVYPFFFLSPHPQIVNSDGATPSVHAGVTVHTDLRSCAHPPPNSSPRSGYLYVLFFTFPSPFPFPPHLPSIAFILSLVKLVFFSRLTVGAVSKALNAHHQFGLLFCRLLSIVCCFWCVGDTLLLCR